MQAVAAEPCLRDGADQLRRRERGMRIEQHAEIAQGHAGTVQRHQPRQRDVQALQHVLDGDAEGGQAVDVVNERAVLVELDGAGEFRRHGERKRGQRHVTLCGHPVFLGGDADVAQ